MAGFLSRFQSSKFYPLFQRILRTLQFLSALSSLIVFSIRVRKLLKLFNSINKAEGAVEGIIAAATLYTLLVLLLNLFLKNGGPKMLRWVLVVLDVAFVGAFIAVSVLTSPKNGKAGPCYGQRRRTAAANNFVDDSACRLPLGTFVTAIISTILHALTAAFQNIRQHHTEHRVAKEEHGYNGNGSPVGRGSTNPMVQDGVHHNGNIDGVHHNNGINHNTVHNDRVHNTSAV